MNPTNDALNRAKNAPQTNPTAPASEVQIRSVAPTQPGKLRLRSTLSAAVYVFVVFTFLLLGVVLLRELNHRGALKVAARTQTESTSAAAQSPARATPAETHGSKVGVATAATTVPGKETTSTNLPAAVAAPAPLKLQAIFFDPVRPSAIISGDTVFVGDRVRAFHVTNISRDSVTLTREGQTKVLKLE